MDNNFDENNSSPKDTFSEENFEGTSSGQAPEQQPADPVTEGYQNIPPAPAQQPNAYPGGSTGFYGQPAQGAPYTGMPVYPQAYIPPNQGGAYPPPVPPAPKKRKLSGGCFWALIALIIIFFVIIVILAAMITSQFRIRNELKEKDNTTSGNHIQTEPAERVSVTIPTSEKPVLEEEFYRNKETGLLTTVGVARTVLPSQVKIEIFDEVPYFPIASGSGIIISTDGYILTNAHVVDGASRMAVKLYDETEEEAVLVGMDRKSDLAVIKIARDDLTAAEIGTSSDLVIGEEVALAGAGGGFENTVTYGHVTGLGREIDTTYISSSTITCIQTDAALNPGNSGGALVNMYGQVIGVAVALMNHETYENIGFSIAIDDAVPIAEELIANGYVSTRSRVGITYVSIGDATANAYGIMSGLCVTEVDPSSNAANIGLIPYDIITHIGGVRVFGAEEVAEALEEKRPGDVVQLTVFRRSVTGKNELFEVPVELSPDTTSSSGYSDGISSEDFFGRDIINK